MNLWLSKRENYNLFLKNSNRKKNYFNSSVRDRSAKSEIQVNAEKLDNTFNLT